MPERLACRVVADIGKAFVDHYFATFDTQRVNLQGLYQATSLLSFEGEQFMGMQNIMTKLTVRHPPRECVCQCLMRWRRACLRWQTLQFQTVQHVLQNIDCHPCGDRIAISVMGDLAVRPTPLPSDMRTASTLGTPRAFSRHAADGIPLTWPPRRQVDNAVDTPLKFSQAFVLAPNGASWFIAHDMFRLNIG